MSADVWHNIAQNIALYSTAGTALIGLSILLWKKVIGPLIQMFAKYKRALQKIDRIWFEVTPNGGTSIKDSVKRIEKESALSRERFKAIYAEAVAAVFETDQDGNFIWVNRTFCKLSGRSPDQLLGHAWHNAICPTVKDETIEEWQKAIDENRELVGHDTEFITPAGLCFRVRCSSYKMRDHRGSTIGYIGICTPVGEGYEHC